MKRKFLKKAACLGIALAQAALFLPVFSACTAKPEGEEPREETAGVQTQTAPRENTRLACLYADETREGSFARNAKPDAQSENAQAVLVPHYGNALYLACNALSGVSREVGLIVLIGPNHPGKGEDVQISGADWYWAQGQMEGDPDAAALLADACAGTLTDTQIAEDWSVQTLIPYARRYFQSARIVTVLLRRGTDRAALQALADAVQALSGEEDVLLLASADFSHYLDPASAQKNDTETLALIEKEDYAAILTLDNGYIDSPETLVTAMLFAEGRGQKLIKLGGLFETFYENGVQKAGSYYAFASMETE